jgi:Mg-chelatase subunit ChlD
MARRDGKAMASSPPPASAPVAESAISDDAGVSAEGSTAKSARGEAESDRMASPTIYPPPRPYPRPRPQSGLLTAGEHDDLLNPELYADYVRRSDLGQWISDLPRLDTARVLTVAVRDGAGRPVPFAPVELACSDGGRMRLTTMADGTVTFFPILDRLGRQVRVRAGGEAWRDVAIAQGRGGQRIDFTVARQAPAVRKLDLMLVIDTTGSMGDEIRYLQSELAAITGSLQRRHPGLDLRIGFVFYRDLGDEYVTATVPFTASMSSAQEALRQRWAGGGGDYPEAMDLALVRAAGQAWRPDAVKTMLLVADAPPHDDKVGLAWRAAEHLRANRVHIVPVAASGVADKAEYAMRAMAALTQSRYTFLTDDSGIGNPHAAPAIDCYLVTRLDALLRRVIDSQLSGRRIEPEEQEVIRKVGQYDNGRCVIPRDYWQD